MSIIGKALQKAQQERAKKLNKINSLVKDLDKRTATAQVDTPIKIDKDVPDAREERAHRGLSRIMFLALPLLFCLGILTAYIYRSELTELLFPDTGKVLTASEKDPAVQKKTVADNIISLLPRKTENTGNKDMDSPASNAGLSLSGIMYSRVDPKAIINGALLSKGETISGYRVVEIFPESVILEKNGTEKILKML